MFRIDWVKRAKELAAERDKIQNRLNFAPYIHRKAIKGELDKVKKDYDNALEKALKQKDDEQKKIAKQKRKK